MGQAEKVTREREQTWCEVGMKKRIKTGDKRYPCTSQEAFPSNAIPIHKNMSIYQVKEENLVKKLSTLCVCVLLIHRERKTMQTKKICWLKMKR